MCRGKECSGSHAEQSLKNAKRSQPDPVEIFMKWHVTFWTPDCHSFCLFSADP